MTAGLSVYCTSQSKEYRSRQSACLDFRGWSNGVGVYPAGYRSWKSSMNGKVVVGVVYTECNIVMWYW